MSNPIQLRGRCQCCCRLQAVTGGRIAKHGYEVKHRGQGGWFSGVCGGHQHAPVEVDRSVLDQVVASIRSQVADLRALADRYEAGTANPATCPTRVYDHEKREYVRIPWHQADGYAQKKEREAQIWQLRNRADAGESQANMMMNVAANCHGRPLQEHVKPAPPAPIEVGDRRVSHRGVIVCYRVDGARVYWKDEIGFKSWTGSRAWRQLEAA